MDLIGKMNVDLDKLNKMKLDINVYCQYLIILFNFGYKRFCIDMIYELNTCYEHKYFLIASNYWCLIAAKNIEKINLQFIIALLTITQGRNINIMPARNELFRLTKEKFVQDIAISRLLSRLE